MTFKKQSVYIPQALADELKAEGERLDRSISWIFRHLWRSGGHIVRSLPTSHPQAVEIPKGESLPHSTKVGDP